MMKRYLLAILIALFFFSLTPAAVEANGIFRFVRRSTDLEDAFKLRRMPSNDGRYVGLAIVQDFETDRIAMGFHDPNLFVGVGPQKFNGVHRKVAAEASMISGIGGTPPRQLMAGTLFPDIDAAGRPFLGVHARSSFRSGSFNEFRWFKEQTELGGVLIHTAGNLPADDAQRMFQRVAEELDLPVDLVSRDLLIDINNAYFRGRSGSMAAFGDYAERILPQSPDDFGHFIGRPLLPITPHQPRQFQVIQNEFGENTLIAQ